MSFQTSRAKPLVVSQDSCNTRGLHLWTKNPFKSYVLLGNCWIQDKFGFRKQRSIFSPGLCVQELGVARSVPRVVYSQLGNVQLIQNKMETYIVYKCLNREACEIGCRVHAGACRGKCGLQLPWKRRISACAPQGWASRSHAFTALHSASVICTSD